MCSKLSLACHALIIICLVALNFSCSKKDPAPAPVNTDPNLTSVDKTSVINGEIITITGENFSKNYNGASQIIATNLADATKQVFLYVLSRTSTQIVAVMTGTGGGAPGSYNLSYLSKPDAGAAKVYASTINVDVVATASGQFFVSSTFTSNHVSAGTVASFGVKNGTTNAGDYSVKLISYNYETGVSTEYAAAVTSVAANGYGGSMDQVNFTVPSVAAGTYEVKVSYSASTLVPGWNTLFFVN